MNTQEPTPSAAGGASALTDGLGGWIPLGQQTPPDGVPVLRWPGWAAEISIDEWCSQYRCFLMSIEEGERATHWMPLPKTPNGEVRGASRLAGEASSREAATSTVVLAGGVKGD